MGTAASRVTGLVDVGRTHRGVRGSVGIDRSQLLESLKGTVEPAVGPVRAGRVITVNTIAGLAYVLDADTKKRFKLSKRFVEAKVFDALRKGTSIRFRDNGHNAVAAAVIA